MDADTIAGSANVPPLDAAEIERLQHASVLDRARPDGAPCDVVVKADRFEISMTGGRRYTLLRKVPAMGARDVKHQLAIDGLIDAAYRSILSSQEPDAIRAYIVGLVHGSVDRSFIAMGLHADRSGRPPTPTQLPIPVCS